MRFSMLGSPNKDQRGISMIELLVGVAIFGLISSGVAYAVMQMLSVNASSNNYVTAIRQVQNVGYWASRDAHQAQTITDEDDPETTDITESLIVEWVEWDGTTNRIVYVVDGNEVKRIVDRNGSTEEYIIARFITPEKTSFVLDDNNRLLTVTVTSTVGGFQRVEETRVYEVIPRAGL
jgi:prepilin-type N-terminal cleavage/methylation domain-containing protein